MSSAIRYPLRRVALAFTPSVSHINASRRTPGLLATMSSRAPTSSVVPSIATTQPGGGQVIDYLGAPQGSGELVFTEEPLGVPRSHGFGYMNVNVRDEIGSYEIIRKVGYGMYSTVWLSRDTRSTTRRYVALKVTTGNVFYGIKKGQMEELSILKRLSDPRHQHLGKIHCTQLFEDFVCEGEKDHGPHICLAMEILGPDLATFCRRYPGETLPLPLVKRTVQQILLALDFLHKDCRVAHTDIKPDNIMIYSPFTDSYIEETINKEPPAYYPSQNVAGIEVHPVVSQPIPLPVSLEMKDITMKLADFGHAQWLDRKLTDEISSIELRAPETVIYHPWDEKVDIWAVGCLIFQLLTGKALFNPRDDPRGRFSADDEHLLHMMQLTGQTFEADMLNASAKAGEFFESNGNLTRITGPILQDQLIKSIQAYNKTESSSELHSSATFIKRCLQLNPADRASAANLLADPWLQS